MTSNLYSDPDFAAGYDKAYHATPVSALHSRFELGLVTEIALERCLDSWLDVCCGTGYHLRLAAGNMRRIGVDREKAMLNTARTAQGHRADYHCRDGMDLSGLGQFGLVTCFGSGYIHQGGVRQALDLLLSMAGAVSTEGEMLLSINDPLGIFRNIGYRTPAYGGEGRIMGFVWDYEEPDGGLYSGCVSPHPDLILETLAPLFREWRWVIYPISGEGLDWQRRALHLRKPVSQFSR